MQSFQYNETVTLGYKHVPIYASSNAITGTKYVTEVYLIQGDSHYPLGQFDEKLDEETVKARFAEIMYESRERQYGQQNTVLRKNLQSRRDRGRTGTAGQQALHSAGGDITKLDR